MRIRNGLRWLNLAIQWQISILFQEKQKVFMKELEDAYKEQTSDPEFQEEISAWDIVIDDGLNAE